MAAKNKQTIYLPDRVWDEIKAEAKRLNRTVSWVMYYSWQHGRKEVTKLQSVNLEEEAP